MSRYVDASRTSVIVAGHSYFLSSGVRCIGVSYIRIYGRSIANTGRMSVANIIHRSQCRHHIAVIQVVRLLPDSMYFGKEFTVWETKDRGLYPYALLRHAVLGVVKVPNSVMVLSSPVSVASFDSVEDWRVVLAVGVGSDQVAKRTATSLPARLAWSAIKDD